MLRCILMMLLLVLPVTACRASGSRIAFQEVEVTLIPAEGKVAGVSTLHLDVPAPVSVQLSTALAVESVFSGGKPLRFTRNGAELAVAQGGVDVVIRYAGAFPNRLPQGTGFGEDPSYGVSAVVSDGGTFLGGETGWYPEPARQPERRRITVRAPAGVRGITAGRLVDERTERGQTVTVWETDRPLRHLSLSAGRFVTTSVRSSGIDVATWLLPGSEDLADRYRTASAEYLDFYRNLLGPYPFEKFAVVENFLPTGYGFPSYTLIGGTVLRLPFIASTSLPHEIVHSWWGNGVLVDYTRGNWSEGLTAYLADYLLDERKSPQDARTHRLKLLTDYAALVPPDGDFPLTRFLTRTDPASRAIGYGKGAMAFHMARTAMGDERFFGALRQMVRDRMFRVTSWDDFPRAFAAAGSDEAARMFAAFVGMNGGLSVRAEQVRLRREANGWRTSGVLVQTPLKEKVPVRVAVAGGGVAAVVVTPVGGAPVPFSVVTKEKPERLVVDPDADLFRTLTAAEIPFTVNRIKGAKTVVGVVAPTCRASVGTFRTLLNSLGHPEARIVPLGEIRSEDTAGAGAIVCGIPDEALAPDLPAVSLAVDSFTAGGKTFAAAGDLLFAVGPRRTGEPTAVFLPLSADAAEAAALKITHYGTYGQLAFSSGKNAVKTTVAPAGGPTVVTLAEER